MDGHQLRGARIHRDMMLVSSVCRRALGCEWGGKGMMLGHSSVVSKYGAPLTRTPPRQSFWGPRAATPGVAANSGPSIDVSSLLRTVQRRRVESLVLGAFHHRQYTVLLCWYWGPT